MTFAHDLWTKTANRSADTPRRASSDAPFADAFSQLGETVATGSLASLGSGAALPDMVSAGEGRDWSRLAGGGRTPRSPAIEVNDEREDNKGPSWLTPGTGILKGAKTALTHTPTTTGFAGGVERVLTGGVDVGMAFAPKPLKTADKVTGNFISGGIKSAIGAGFSITDSVINGDTRALGRFTDNAMDGKYGAAAGLASRAGDWLGGAAHDVVNGDHGLFDGIDMEAMRRLARQRAAGSKR